MGEKWGKLFLLWYRMLQYAGEVGIQIINPGVVWGSETLGLVSTGCRMLHVVHKHEETGGKA